MTFVPWTEIESFHNVRKYTQAHPEILNGNSKVSYLPKVKLHGTNAGVRIYTDGTVIAQSRSTDLSVGNDNAGFAKWVESNKDKWAAAIPSAGDVVIFGEWVGPGVQKGVAVSEIPKKSFVVFAARPVKDFDILISQPEALANLVAGIPDTYVLPWYTQAPMVIDWNADAKHLTLQTLEINEWVEAVEKNDPWVEATFGIKGTGEGLVFYPVSKEHFNLKGFNDLCFKAKGEKHKNIKTAAPAQVNPEVAASVDQFVDLVLTEARLEQGAAGSYEMKNIGKFLAWISGDVQKETQDELQASNLTWEQVSKAITNKARSWYLSKSKAL